MIKRIEIKFEKGEEFTAVLLEDKAPKTCKIVWENLPLSAKIGQGIYSARARHCIPNTLLRKRHAQ
jgi:hypothetical protein